MDITLVLIAGGLAIVVLIVLLFVLNRKANFETDSRSCSDKILAGCLTVLITTPILICMLGIGFLIWSSTDNHSLLPYSSAIKCGAAMLAFMSAYALYEKTWIRRLCWIGGGILFTIIIMMYELLDWYWRYRALTIPGKWKLTDVWEIAWMFLTGAVIGLINASINNYLKKHSSEKKASQVNG